MAGKRTTIGIIEQIDKLTKEELLELLKHPHLHFPLSRLEQQDLDCARGRVIRRKAEAEYHKWESFEKIRIPAKNAGHVTVAQFYLKTARKEAHFNRYMALSDKADRLEFGEV